MESGALASYGHEYLVEQERLTTAMVVALFSVGLTLVSVATVCLYSAYRLLACLCKQRIPTKLSNQRRQFQSFACLPLSWTRMSL